MLRRRNRGIDHAVRVAMPARMMVVPGPRVAVIVAAHDILAPIVSTARL
jgi:hypothetical protein